MYKYNLRVYNRPFDRALIASECTYNEWSACRDQHVHSVTMRVNYRNTFLEAVRH